MVCVWGNVVVFHSGAFKKMSGRMSAIYPVYVLSGPQQVKGNQLNYTK